ncbi:hypothetical protein [Enterovibrio baiacu]|uniref:hypothetical protein n=1 Tax=Enterovibrio baiacu TaxID=2491023 RepID=UPI001011A7CF|nr:hypothetical protein [Enterovibrio baiacu]MBE1275021.1 hypothetical protein [Enterovibrio baiacu]
MSIEATMNSNQAVEALFGVEGKFLRDKANSYIRNKTVPEKAIVREGYSDAQLNMRSKCLVAANALPCLYNALILDAFFNDTKRVKKIMSSVDERLSSCELMKELLLGSQRSDNAQTEHLSPEATAFLREFSSPTFAIQTEKFSNPFIDQKMPQADLALKNSGLLYALLRHHRLRLSLKEQLLIELMGGDLKAAYDLASTIEDDLRYSDPVLADLVDNTKKQYHAAESFQALLNQLPK